MGKKTWTKRDKTTGEFIDQKKAPAKKKFKGVRTERAMLHAIVDNRPHREINFADMLLDVSDHDSDITAQWLLIRKMSPKVSGRISHPVIFRDEREPSYKRYMSFLESDRKVDDDRMLSVNRSRFIRTEK